MTRPSPGNRNDSVFSEAAGKSVFRGYAKLLALCVATALVVSLAIVLVQPPPESELPRDATSPDRGVSTEATIELPSEPAEFTAEAMRAELGALGEAMLARFPDVAESLHVVALLYADLQRTKEAEAIWRKCVALAPEQVGPYVGLASAAMDLGKDEEAVDLLNQARARGSSSAELFFQLGKALTKLGRLDEAADVLAEAVERYPEFADNWQQLGQVRLQQNEFAEAEADLRRAVALGADSETVYFQLANACARQGKKEEAAQYRQRFAAMKQQQETSPDVPFQDRYNAELRRIAVRALVQAATVYDHQGDEEKAERLFTRALALDPTQPRACNELAMFYRNHGRLGDAYLVQKHLASIDHTNVYHLINLASLASDLGDDQVAEQALKDAIGLRPDLAAGYVGLAQLYLQRSDWKRASWFAEASLRQHASSDEEVLRAYLVLASARQQLGQTDLAMQAVTELERLVAENPRLKDIQLAVPPALR